MKSVDNCSKNKGKIAKLSSKIVLRIRSKIFILIFAICFTGLIVPFAAQAILPFFFDADRVDGISLWNQYVSLILGIVAAIMSIVSLYLCFHSEETANNFNKEISRNLAILEEKISNISDKQDYLNNKLGNSLGLEVNSSTTVKKLLAVDDVDLNGGDNA